MSPQFACLLCGADTGEVTIRLVEWREPIPGRRYESLPRCRDVEGCWGRVAGVLGEDWPVNDGRPARAAQPMAAAEPPSADATMEDPLMRDPAWMS